MVKSRIILSIVIFITLLLFISTQFNSDFLRTSLQFASKSPPTKSKVTVVSAYYVIDGGKKHSVQDYRLWLGHFLSSCELPIVFFCASELEPLVKELRGEKPIDIIIDYATPFKTPPLIRLGGIHWAEQQHYLDPESSRHVKEVYGSFSVKPWLLKHAKDIDPFESEYFYWVDAGAFREASMKPPHTLSNLGHQLDLIYDIVPFDTLILASIRPFEDGVQYVSSVKRTDEMDSGDFIQGGFFGGTPLAIEWFEREFMSVVVQQSNLGRFAAKEQSVFTHVARLNWPKVYIQNTAFRSPTGCGADIWFTWEFWADGQDCHIPAWNGPQYLLEIA